MGVRAAPRSDFGWITERLGLFLSPNARAIAAYDREGKIAGMVAYDGWTPNSAIVNIALDSPIAWRRLARPTFEYPFNEGRRGLLVAMVASDNLRSMRLTEHVGFRETYRIRDGISVGVDLVVFEMRREECRWLEV
jgi:RimJ/RimL family protein N-acetyltransferase